MVTDVQTVDCRQATRSGLGLLCAIHHSRKKD